MNMALRIQNLLFSGDFMMRVIRLALQLVWSGLVDGAKQEWSQKLYFSSLTKNKRACRWGTKFGHYEELGSQPRPERNFFVMGLPWSMFWNKKK